MLSSGFGTGGRESTEAPDLDRACVTSAETGTSGAHQDCRHSRRTPFLGARVPVRVSLVVAADAMARDAFDRCVLNQQSVRPQVCDGGAEQ
jgi:hypothetical protein